MQPFDMQGDAQPDGGGGVTNTPQRQMTVADAPMRTTTDAWRSLKRYLAFALGDEWEVRLWDEPGEFSYPFARVERVGAPTYAMPCPDWTEVAQTFAVHAYVEPSSSANDAILAAASLEDLLYAAFYNTTVPARVPIFDYKHISGDGAAAARFPHDWMRVESFGTQQLTSAEDERLRWVVGTIRLGWTRPAKLAPIWNIVQNVELRHWNA